MKTEYLICLCAFGIIALVRPGSAIHCFVCNSHNDSRCADDEVPEKMLLDCSKHSQGSKYVLCRKIVQTIDFPVNGLPPDSRVIRACGWDNSSYKDTCYSRGGFGGRQEVCSCMTDKCNNASSVSFGLYLFLGPVLMTITYLYQFIRKF